MKIKAFFLNLALFKPMKELTQTQIKSERLCSHALKENIKRITKSDMKEVEGKVV